MGNRAYTSLSGQAYPDITSGGGGGGGYTPTPITGLEDNAGLVLNNGATLTDGKLVLAGGTQYAALADSTGNYDKVPGQPLVISLKFKVNAVLWKQTIIGHHTGSPNYDGWVIMTNGNNIDVFTNQGGTTPTPSNSKTFSMTLEGGQEYGLIVVIEDSPNTITVYVNDLKISSQTPFELPLDTSVDLWFGIQKDGATLYNPMVGEIWDIEIFQSLISAADRLDKTSGIFVT